MKHIDLIKTLYANRHLIDSAFNGEDIENLPSELIDDIGVFQKVAKKYELSDMYVQFANTMLKRVDANYTFGDYNEEIKLLIKQKEDYLGTGDLDILNRIKSLVRTLYKKIEQRDILINARINDIINDNDLSIERIIKDAQDVDSRIGELIEAHSENLKIFGKELRGIDDELDEILVSISIDMLPFTNNIHQYNKRLSDFILRTEKRKQENKKLSSLAFKIIKEQDYELKSLLLSNTQLYHHTIKERRIGFVQYLPNLLELKRTTFLEALSRVINVQKVERKANNEKPYKISDETTFKAVKLDNIYQDINKDKPEDVYKYILKHKEIIKFKEDGTDKNYAFKTYLTVVQDERNNIVFNKNFNNKQIRIAKWI